MKLFEQFRGLSTQARWMIVVIILLLAMIATRWGYISHTAGAAFRDRVKGPAHTEQTETSTPEKIAPAASEGAQTSPAEGHVLP